MDDKRFDAWTRLLAEGHTRRKVLKIFAGGAILGGAAATRLDQATAQCPERQVLCNDICVDLGSDAANCGACATQCSAGLLCCAGICQECCSTDDCEPCERCIDGGACQPLDCGDCATCLDGACVPDSILCPEGQVACCEGNELFCSECCDDSDCGSCELCHQGDCVPCERGSLVCCDDICVSDGECCVGFGEVCGLLEVSAASDDWPAQLDCCDGLVCCDTGNGSVCAACCSDHECPRGSICCAGQCRDIECCIDDAAIGLDPNRRCPEGCGCIEGSCDCYCQSNDDCAWDACCCNDGTCSANCCVPGCAQDSDCDSGLCCCHDGSCSTKCCTTYTPPVSTLPGTGSGCTSEGGGFLLAGAGTLAAYLTARQLRQEPSHENESATEE